MKQNIPDAPAHLRALLQRLHTESGLTITQHIFTPRADEWYGGDWGPYESAEDAIAGGVKWLRGLYEDAAAARDEAESQP